MIDCKKIFQYNHNPIKLSNRSKKRKTFYYIKPKAYFCVDFFEKWLSKGRVLVTIWQDEKIVGYGWAGNGTSARVESGENTFAIRLGSAASGKGLATHFARLIVEATSILFGLKDIWLETWQSNGGAVHIYHKIGFIDVAEEKSTRKKADGTEVEDVRLYMTLPNENLPVAQT